MTALADALTTEITAALAALTLRAAGNDEPDDDAGELDNVDLANWAPDFEPHRQQIATELALLFLGALRLARPGPVSDVDRQAATRYALRASAALLPGGDYDLAAATARRVQAVLAQAIAERWTLVELRAALRSDPIFSAGRAALIAMNETTRAVGAANRAAALGRGMDEHAWETTGDAPCDECIENEAEGWIGIDAGFPNGSAVPLHPNCACLINYQQAGEKAITPAAPLRTVKCRNCGRWIGHHNATEGTGYCPKCKEVPLR